MKTRIDGLGKLAVSPLLLFSLLLTLFLPSFSWAPVVPEATERRRLKRITTILTKHLCVSTLPRLTASFSSTEPRRVSSKCLPKRCWY